MSSEPRYTTTNSNDTNTGDPLGPTQEGEEENDPIIATPPNPDEGQAIECRYT